MFNNLILKNILFEKHTAYKWNFFKKNISFKKKLYYINIINKKIKNLVLNKIYKAIIINIIDNYVIVYINNDKYENFIPIKEFNKKKIKIGDIIKIVIIKKNSLNGNVISYIEALKIKIWKQIIFYYKNQKKISVKLYKKINKGYIVKIKKYLFGFLSKYQIINYEDYKLKDKINVIIININFKNKNIILSNKKFYNNIKFKKNIVKYNITKNKIVLGKVKKIINNNLIININNNIKCFLLYRDISWKNNNYLKKIKIDKKYKFKILNIDYKKKNIKLGLKQLKNHSWRNLINKKFKIGNVIKCKIYKITNLVVKVTICNYYIKGLIYINELNWHINYSKNRNIKKIGDILKCLIIDINYYNKKVILSYKRLLLNKFKSNNISKKYLLDNIYKGIIKGFDLLNNMYILINNLECIIYNYNVFFNFLSFKGKYLNNKYFKKNNIIYFSLLRINYFTRNFIGIYKNIYFPIYMKYPIFNIGYINFAKIIFITKKNIYLIFNKIIGVKILLLNNIKKKLNINDNILIKIINYNINTYILYAIYIKNNKNINLN
ncbi:MAG: S1 RNA-binding domain-containing protein [Candidatus Shikimatogenerans sp. Tcar]|uniref:S1 RNA-binding domain-containing protein n=1 Tax=Candidatus Shikimatogenerans sp. Tcar TaxID=3158565 RepID=A0AAU7QSR8_9FLAO